MMSTADAARTGIDPGLSSGGVLDSFNFAHGPQDYPSVPSFFSGLVFITVISIVKDKLIPRVRRVAGHEGRHNRHQCTTKAVVPAKSSLYFVRDETKNQNWTHSPP